MADYAYPKALTGMQDVQWSTYMASIVDDGGTTPGAFAPTASGVGMSVSLAPGEAIVRGILTGDSAAATVVIGAAPSTGLTRIDTIVKRLDRSGTPVVKTAVVQGVASQTPVRPTLTQNPSGVWEWPVADVRVVGGVVSITSAAVTDRRTFTGTNVGKWAVSPASGKDGQMGFNTTSGEWEYYRQDGNIGRWRPLIELGTVGIGNGGTGSTSATGARQNLEIFVQSSAPAHRAGRVWIKTA